MAPRGYRNFNPGNIEDGPYAQSLPGYAGVEPEGRFARFDSMDNGFNAMSTLYNRGGYRNLNTINDIVSRWAPESDGNNPAAYASFVGNKLGIDPNAPLDKNNPEQMRALAAAMAHYENGAAPPAAPGAPGAPALAPPPAAPVAGPQPRFMQPALAAGGAGPGPLSSPVGRAIEVFDPGTTLQNAGAWLMSISDPKALGALGAINANKQKAGSYSVHYDENGHVYAVNSADGRMIDYGVRPGFDPNYDAKKAYDVEEAKKYAELNHRLPEASLGADATLATIQQARQVLSNPAVYQGSGGEWVAEGKKLLASLGGNVEGIADADVAKALANQLTLAIKQYAGSMPGSLSDKDLAFLKNASIGLDKSPEANMRILDAFERHVSRTKALEGLRQAYVEKNGRLDNGFHRAIADYDKQQEKARADAAAAQSKAAANRRPLDAFGTK